MGNIGSFKPLEFNGQTSFKTLDEAKQVAEKHKGFEAIRQRDDGAFEVLTLDTESSFSAAAAKAHQSSVSFNQEVSFTGKPNASGMVDPNSTAPQPGKAQLSIELSDGSSILIPVESLSKDKLMEALKQAPQNLSPAMQADFAKSAAPIISALRDSGTLSEPLPVIKQMSTTRMDAVAGAYTARSKDLMEKEFRFAPEGSDKWKLLKAMELLGKLNSDAGTIKDPEAQETLNMRRGQLEDLIKELNEKPEVQEAYTRIRATAMQECGISQSELFEQANYILSDAFQASLKGKPEAEQKQLMQKELAKIQFFNPDFAQTVAAELGAKTLVASGFEQYRGLSPEKQVKAKQVVEYLIDDAIKSANTTQDKGLKPLRELQKLASGLPPSQWEAFRKILVNEAFMEENMVEGLDGKGLLKKVEEAEKAGTLKLTDAQKEQIKSIKWHGNLAKALSTVAAIGTGISLGRSIEELQNKGLNLKSSMDLINKTISMIGATKDIAATGSLLLKTAGATSLSESAGNAAKFFEGFKLVKWAGPITSAITAVSDGIDTYDRIQNEDKAGAWLKGIGTGAGVVATVAGGAALWTTSATVASFAGPIGLAAVAVVGITAITYNCVKESEETGEFRQDLRKLGISEHSEKLEAAFQQASEVTRQTRNGQVTVHDAQKGFQWAKDRPVAERADLIGSLMDQATDPYEEEVISRLFKDAVGKNKDATSNVDDFDRLISRTDMRRVGRELQPNQLTELINTLKARAADPKAEKALQQLVIGIAADHEYSLLKKADGSPQDFITAMPPAVKKEIAAGLMTGYTSGTAETLLSKLVLDLPDQELAELLGRGGADLIKNLVSELPQAETGRLMARFAELDKALGQAETDLKAHNTPENKERVDVLKHALDVPLNNFMMAMSEEANSVFYSYEATMAKTLSPEITRHLSPETITHVCRKLMDTTVWTPDQSSAALVKLIKQTTPEQFKALMAGSTDTFLRKILAGSTTYEQSKELLQVFLDKAGGKPDRNFQTIALGMMHQPTVIGMDWSYENVVKDFIKANPKLDLSEVPALKVVASDHNVADLAKDRTSIAKMSNEDKAIVIKYLMDSYTSDASETLIHDILKDANTQDKAKFKELISMIDCYQLAKELGDPVLAGQGDQESLDVMEMIARDGDPKDFTAYANGVAIDRNQNVLCQFTAKPENQGYLKNLPAPVVKEMCESLMKGITIGRGEKAVTMLLKHASDEAFLDAVKDKDFATWLTSELQTNDANWVLTATGDDDQIKTLMQRLGKMAQGVEQAEQQPAASRTAEDKTRVGQKAKVSAALESFVLACAQADYPEVIHNLATSPDTKASVHLLSPAALKTATESLMAGWASGADQSAVTALLDKSTPQQLRDLLGKSVGGQALTDKLASKLTTTQLRGLMEKMISDHSLNAGMGFSYLAASLAKEHEGQTLRDLIAHKPEVVRQIHPTVLQNMVVSLSKGWTSSESREAIAGILKNATPEQLELILQSNTGDPKHVSDWVVYTLNDGELNAVTENLAKGQGGRGTEAFLGSLAHDKPAALTAVSQDVLKKFSPESLTAAAKGCVDGFTASTLGMDYRGTLDQLLHVAEAKGDTTLKPLLAGIDLSKAGPMLTGNQARFNQVLQEVTRLGDDKQFKAFIDKVPNDTLMVAWPSLRDSKISLNPAERAALFNKAIDAAHFANASELLKGVSGTGAASSLIGTPEGRAMVAYMAEHLGNFGKDDAIKAGKIILAGGNPDQIDAAFKQINTRFYFGRGADVVKDILGSVTDINEKKAIYGKMPKSTLESLVGTMDSSWYKTVGQITGSYGDNMDFLKGIADLVDPSGKRTIILALANSWWTPPRAEQLMTDILKDTSFDNHQFYDLVDGMTTEELKTVISNIEDSSQAGQITARIAEAEIRKDGHTGYNFEVAAGSLSYNHRSDAVDTMRTTLKANKLYDKVKPEHIVMMANNLMNGATHSAEENAIYKLLEDASWPQFAQAMSSDKFRADLQSELGSDQWASVQQWFWDIPKHVK